MVALRLPYVGLRPIRMVALPVPYDGLNLFQHEGSYGSTSVAI